MNKLIKVQLIFVMAFTLFSCFVDQGETCVITYDANGGIGTMPTQLIKIDEEHTLDLNQFSNEGFVFIGWSTTPSGNIVYEDGTIVKIRSSKHFTLYAVWGINNQVGSIKSEILVGEKGITYTIPTDIYDSSIAQVNGGFLMAKTETTYELWYEVRVWAEDNGYFFQNKGREGNDGTIGALPSSNKLEPVTTVSWRDVIVWCNAYSEFKDRHPVYRTTSGVIIKDSRDANAPQVDSAIKTANNGYRLPTSHEWEMAARWLKTSEYGAIAVGGRYWTPGSYASGAKDPYYLLTETSLVAWCIDNSSQTTHRVATKKANDLGLYDMSGNVWEWCSEMESYSVKQSQIIRGGGYNHSYDHMQVGSYIRSYPYTADNNYGFRFVTEDDAVFVGEKGVTYTIPTDIYDSSTAQVNGGFLMATTETTYELWHEVRVWAEDNGYFFQNKGREGNDGTIGDLPSSNKLEPVTSVSWHDAIVWCNAYSVFKGLDPVYRTTVGVIIKDAREANAPQLDSAIQTANNGYRLPTINEWEMAARWRNSSGDGAIAVGGRYWTPESYASGAKAASDNLTETFLVAWCKNNSSQTTHRVATKNANDLGIYDMSGNVWEWCFDWNPKHVGQYRMLCGGSYTDSCTCMKVGYLYGYLPWYASSDFGFRFVWTR